MRYTTIIDISEMPDLYRNERTRIIYLHLCLKAGYHDEDRDKCRTSFRRLAAETGATLAATRNAVKQLEQAGLLTRAGETWTVKKWILDTPPTPRPKTVKQAAQTASITAAMDKQEAELEAWRKSLYEAVRASSKEELQTWLTELESGKRTRLRGVRMTPNQNNIAWLKSVIKKLP